MKLQVIFVVAIALVVMCLDRADAFSPRDAILSEGMEIGQAGKIVEKRAVRTLNNPFLYSSWAR